MACLNDKSTTIGHMGDSRVGVILLSSGVPSPINSLVGIVKVQKSNATTSKNFWNKSNV